MTDMQEAVLIRPDSASVAGPFFALAFRIRTAERQLENRDVPADVLDRIANDIDAATEGGTDPACGTEELHERESS